MRSVVQLYPGPPLYRGAVAQLGERLVCNQEATGSIPVSSTRISGIRMNAYGVNCCGKYRGGDQHLAVRAPGSGLVDPDDPLGSRRYWSRRRTGKDGGGEPGTQSSYREWSRSGYGG